MKLFKHFCIASLACITSISAGQKLDHNALFLDGEFLYWRPDQTAMTYCLVANETITPIGTKNKEVHQDSNWAPGFRVGAGYILAHTSCDISAYWTRFHHSMHSSSPSGPFIFGTQLLGVGGGLVLGGTGVDAGKAHSNWHLKMDLVELDFGYNLCFHERFLLHPYIGVEGGWVNQNRTVKYDHFFDTSSQIFFDSEIHHKNNFHGVGPKIGINTDFSLGAGFGLIGNFAAVFLCGKANNPVKYEIEGDESSFPLPKTVVKYKQNRLVPALQAQLGLNWRWRLACHFTFTLGAMYEVQYFIGTWRNQNSGIQNLYIADAGYGNLMLQGLTAQGKLTF